MSIDIDQKKLRIAEPQVAPIEPNLDFIRAFPISISPNWVGEAEITYDGEWIKQNCISGSLWKAMFMAGISFFREPLGLAPALCGRVRMKAPPDDSQIFFFFFEPTKGNFDNYQGFDTRGGTVHYARNRLAGVETTTNLDPQDWKVEHEFKLIVFADGSKTQFFIDGVLKAEHTTNIRAPPIDMIGLEDNGYARIMYLRYPYGLWVGL